MKASAGKPRRRKRAQYQKVSVLQRGRLFSLRETGLSYRDMRLVQCKLLRQYTVRVWNKWREEGRTQRRGGTGPHNVTTAWDDRHLVRMTVTDRTVSSTGLSRRWSTAADLDLSASTVRRRLLRAGLVAHMSMHRLPLSRDH